MPPSYLTRQGFEKLQNELDHLRSVKRLEIAARLHEAMDGGELIEDAEYEAFVEGRIQELEILLANARVIEDKGKMDIVQIAATVTIQEDQNEPEVYTIVGPAEASPREGRISHESPFGKALLNHKAGDIVHVEAPDGAFTVRIIKVE
jgi:transcription elongation factor GreA